jgi:hypothetical protein
MKELLFVCPTSVDTDVAHIIERFVPAPYYQSFLCKHCIDKFSDCEPSKQCARLFEKCENSVWLKTPLMEFVREKNQYESYSDEYVDERWESKRIVIVRPCDSTDSTDSSDLFKKFSDDLDAGLLDFMQKDGEALFKTKPKEEHLITSFRPDYGKAYDSESFVIGSVKPVIDNAFFAGIPYSINTGIKYFNSDGSERKSAFPKGTKCRLHLKYCGPEYIKRNSFWNEWLLLGVYAESNVACINCAIS